MLYHVRMDVEIPASVDEQTRQATILAEKEYALGLQKQGKWLHLWRIVGEYANYSVFDVESNDELHQILSGLPMFPWMKLKVTPVATHPSALKL